MSLLYLCIFGLVANIYAFNIDYQSSIVAQNPSFYFPLNGNTVTNLGFVNLLTGNSAFFPGSVPLTTPLVVRSALSGFRRINQTVAGVKKVLRFGANSALNSFANKSFVQSNGAVRFTVEAWIRVISGTGTTVIVGDESPAAGANDFSFKLSLVNNQIRFAVHTGIAGTFTRATLLDPVIPLNQVTHVVATYSWGTSSGEPLPSINLFINGNLHNSPSDLLLERFPNAAAWSTPISAANRRPLYQGNTLYIGGDNTAAQHTIDIDEVALYASVFNTDAVRDNYINGIFQCTRQSGTTDPCCIRSTTVPFESSSNQNINGYGQFATSAVTCRNSSGECDSAEVCTEASSSCPADSFKPADTDCGSPISEVTPTCESRGKCSGVGDVCIPQVKTRGSVCRPVNGSCDVPETCDGFSPICPVDNFIRDLVCRPSASPCDIAERCTGNEGTCPPDVNWQPATKRCGDGNTTNNVVTNGCNAGLFCSGTSASCGPSSSPAAAGALCRPTQGPCDQEDFCDGTSLTCPYDSKRAAGSICRTGSTSIANCDIDDVCDGVSDGCVDQKAPNGTLCRGANGPCDLPEFCVSGTCPSDGKKPNTVVCRNANTSLICDKPENCNGVSNLCPLDTPFPASANRVCRPSAGVCDKPETCNGQSFDCPADTFYGPSDPLPPLGTPCRSADSLTCDIEEVCDGTSASCPPEIVVQTSDAITCSLSESVPVVASKCINTNGTVTCRDPRPSVLKCQWFGALSFGPSANIPASVILYEEATSTNPLTAAELAPSPNPTFTLRRVQDIAGGVTRDATFNAVNNRWSRTFTTTSPRLTGTYQITVRPGLDSGFETYTIANDPSCVRTITVA